MPESIDALEVLKKKFEEIMDDGIDGNEERLRKIMKLQAGLLSRKGRTLSYLVELEKLRDMGDV